MIRIVLLLSLGLNMLLLGALAWLQFSGAAGPPAVSTGAAQAAAVRASPGESLDWRTVQSPDYRRYIANLRAIGCPESTIFDIIVADVNTLYAMKARSISAEEWRYWQSTAEIPSREEIRNQKLRRELEQEKRELLRSILGADALRRLDESLLLGGEAAAQHKLAFLDAAKRERLTAVLAKHAQLEQQAVEWDAYGVATEEAARRLAELQQRRRGEVEALLSAEELFELDLRSSPTADRLRRELPGFHPTETEFRALFQVRRTYEEYVQANQDVRDPNVVEARLQAERRFAEEARVALGDARYAQYERSRDLDYQNVLRLTQYFNLPEGIAAEVHALKQQVDAQVEQFNANASLSQQQRQQSQSLLQSETEQALQSLLGARVLAEYRRYNRWWIWN